MKTLAWMALVALGLSGCGTPPNQRLLTRTSSYLKAMSFGQDSGYPLDIAELVEYEQRVIAGTGIVAVPDAHLLLAVSRAYA